MEKLTKTTIKIFILYVTVSLMFGCVTKKKLKESQELQTTYLLDQTETKWTNSVQKLENNFSESTLKTVKEYLKSYTESTSTNENESTSITGTLPPGEKETSVTVGSTTIKNNGGNVSFDIKSSKQLTKDLETINSELTQRYNLMESTLISVVNELNEFKETQLKINEDLKSELEKKTKETDKKGLSFWMVIILILIVSAVLFVAIKLFRNKVPI